MGSAGAFRYRVLVGLKGLPSHARSTGYLVRLRLIEFQDWHTPSPSSDDDMGHDDEDSDSGVSNFNGYHPGFGGGRRPCTTRFGGPVEPRLGPGSGPACRPRESTCAIVVGDWTCPVPSPKDAMPCMSVSAVHAAAAMRVVESAVDWFDFGSSRRCSPSPVKVLASDPMLSEADLCTPQKVVSACEARATTHSIDCWPRGGQGSRCRSRGLIRAALDDELDLLAVARVKYGPSIEPEMIFGAAIQDRPDRVVGCDLGEAVDFCLSGPEADSGPNSPVHAAGGGLSLEPTSAASETDPSPPDEPMVPLSPEPTALHGHVAVLDGAATAQPPTVDDFIATFRKLLQQPILVTAPRARVTRRERARERTDAELVPKRSARLAVKSKNRLPKPEAQARRRGSRSTLSCRMRRLLMSSRKPSSCHCLLPPQKQWRSFFMVGRSGLRAAFAPPELPAASSHQ